MKRTTHPDIIINSVNDLSTIAHLASTIEIKENTKLMSHAEIQALIHLKAIEKFLLESYVEPNFEIKL